MCIRDSSFCGHEFECVDAGFGNDQPVDVVVRPEDWALGEAGKGALDGVVESAIFKGVHYEMMIRLASGELCKAHSTVMENVGSRVSLSVVPFNIHIMKKMAAEPPSGEAMEA